MLNKRDFLTFGVYVVIITVGIVALTGFYSRTNNVLKIVEYTDPNLREISNRIDHIDNHIISLSNDMIATLRYRAITDFFLKRKTPRGLAAPQVGISERLILCGLNGEIKVMLNPEILEREGIYADYDDCMSVQKIDNKVIQRSAYIKIKYKGLDNRERILIARNDDAALLEHEIDHLNGVLNIDYWDETVALSPPTQ